MHDLGHDTEPSGSYALGHSADELDRLRTQARLIDPITRRFFEEAGIRPGMRVLDVGCGAGDTSMLLLEMVSDHGEVIGVDRAPAAIAAARMKSTGRANLSFLEGDPAEMHFEQRFDAVVGRYVLMFQKHPAELLRASAPHVRSGGLIAFHELDYEGIASSRPCRLSIGSGLGTPRPPAATGPIHEWARNSPLPSSSPGCRCRPCVWRR